MPRHGQKPMTLHFADLRFCGLCARQAVVFVLATLFLAGAGLGFWIVRKFVLMPDGTPDPQTALFTTWALRALGVVFCFLVQPTDLHRPAWDRLWACIESVVLVPSESLRV